MRFIRPVSQSRAVAYGLVVAAIALVGLVPWVVVPARNVAADDAAPKETIHRGKFASFKGGVLRIKGEDGKEFDGIEVADDTQVVNFVKGTKIEGTAPEAFNIWEPGAVISVTMKNGGVTLVEIGVKKEADRLPDRVPNKTSAKASPKEKFVWGKFVSFQNGELVIQANSGALIENQVPANAKTLVWNHDAGAYQPADTVATLSQLKAGTWTVVNVSNENVMVRIGARKGSTTGTFVSFKDDRLLILGKNLGESFTKKYGNNVHFHKFRDDVPVYESVDGGEYQLLGTANKVLGDVKEGAIVTVHGEGDDNITLVQIGMPKAP